MSESAPRLLFRQQARPSGYCSYEGCKNKDDASYQRLCSTHRRQINKKRNHEMMSKIDNGSKLNWYEIIENVKKQGIKIGEGAYGSVYLIVHMNKYLAIKISNICVDSDDFYDMLNEGLSFSYIDSKYIANYIGLHIDEKDWKVYIALEFYKGGTLSQYIRQNKNIKEITIKKILYSLLSGISYLNLHGITHRDIKPSNILLKKDTIEDPTDVVISDLGLQSKTNERKNVVTRWYRPIEIPLKYPYSENIDIFSVGCILIELITGKPFLKSSDDGKEHILTILENFGNLTKEVVSFFDKTKSNSKIWKFVKKYNRQYTFKNEIFKSIDGFKISKELKSIIKSCLELNPSKRLNAGELLKNNYFGEFNGGGEIKEIKSKRTLKIKSNQRTLIENSILKKLIEKYNYSEITYLISFDIFKKYSYLYYVDNCNLQSLFLIIIMIANAYTTDYGQKSFSILKTFSKNNFKNLCGFRKVFNKIINIIVENNIFPVGNYYNKMAKFNKSEFLLFLYLTEDNICYNSTVIEKINHVKELHKKLTVNNNYKNIVNLINIKDNNFLNNFYNRIKISCLSNLIKEEI